jgi:hypothetical protein
MGDREDEPTLQVIVETAGRKRPPIEERLLDLRKVYTGYMFEYLAQPKPTSPTRVETIVNNAGDEIFVHLERNSKKISAYDIYRNFSKFCGEYDSIIYSHYADDSVEESLLNLASQIMIGHTKKSENGEPLEYYQLKLKDGPIQEFTLEGIGQFTALPEEVINAFLEIEKYLKKNIPLYFRHTSYKED